MSEGPRDSLINIAIEGRIAIIRFDRGSKANALSAEALRQLTEAARRFHARPDISAVVLTGRPEVFTLGADFKDPERAAMREQGLAERRISLRLGPEMCEAWEKVDALTVMAIEGWCVGGGMALAAACDLRVLGRSAKLYIPEVERGMNMSWGSIPRLVALVGPARAKRLAALCEKIDAPTAQAWGLADVVAEDGQALAAARQLAERAAQLPPTALKMVKSDINAAALALSRLAGRNDTEAFALMEQSEDFKEGIEAFLENREPKFTGN